MIVYEYVMTSDSGFAPNPFHGACTLACCKPKIRKGVANEIFVKIMILSRLVDTFISRISLTMLPVPNPHNTVCVLSWEEARHWQSRSSGYSSS